MRAPLLISVVLHLLAVCSIYYSKMSSFTAVEAPIILSINPIMKQGNKVTTIPYLRKLLPHFGPGRGSNQLDTNAEVAKALDEVAEGNPFKRKEHKFFSYYERIKGEVEPLWISGVRDLVTTARRQRTNWRISGGKVATIVALIDKNGAVVDVLLVKSSGDVKLDSLAVSLMRGRRYPNPPEGLVESDGFGRLVWFFKV